MKQLFLTNQNTQRDSDSLEKYFQEINKIPLLTTAREAELGTRIKAGDLEALDEMTKSNLRFVVSVAKQYQNQGLPLNDLINEGNIGLIKAVKAFDTSKGFKFITYAVWWIRATIMQSLTEHSRIVRVPVNKLTSFRKIKKVMNEFEQEFHREPTENELEDIVKLSSSDILKIKNMMNGAEKHLSMDAPINDLEENTLKDVLEDDNCSNTETVMFKESLKHEIRDAMKILPERDTNILSACFGLNGENDMTLNEISVKFNLTAERIRQIKEFSIRKMRKASSANTLKQYITN